MSKKRRRRPPRNIWHAPPEPPKPFDYEQVGVEKAAEREPRAEVEAPPRVRRAKHLQKRPVVLPRFSSKTGRHSAGPTVEADAPAPEAELEVEPEEVVADLEPEEVVADLEPEEVVAEVEPDEPARDASSTVLEDEPDAEAVAAEPPFEDEPVPEPPTRRSKHLRKRAIVMPRKTRPGRHSLRAEPEVEAIPDASAEPVEDLSPAEAIPSAEPVDVEAAEVVEEPAIDDHDEIVFDADPLPDEELFPDTRHRSKHLRKRPIVVPRKTRPGRHSLRPDDGVELTAEETSTYAPPVTETDATGVAGSVDAIETPEVVEPVETTTTEEAAARDGTRSHRPRHGRRSRVPRRSRRGKHSIAPEAPPLPEEPEPSDIPESQDAVDELEPEATSDDVTIAGEIEPYEPRTRSRKRRKRGRHRRPGSGVLPGKRSARGRHAVAPESTEPASEEVVVIEDLDEPVAEVDVAVEAAQARPEIDAADEEEDVLVLEEETDGPYEDEGVMALIEEETDVIDVVADEFFEDFDEDEEEALESLEPRRKRARSRKQRRKREPREARTEERAQRTIRKKQRRPSLLVRMIAGSLAAAVAAIGTVAVATALQLDESSSSENERAQRAAAPVPDEIPTTTLVYSVRESDEDAGPIWLTLLTYNPADESGGAIYIPAHLASEIPGRGLMSLNEGWVSGGPPLLLASAENLLGMKIDRYVELSDNDAQALFDAIGPMTVEVPSEVSVARGVSQSRLIFDEGPQELSPDLLVRLLYTRGLDVDDAELGSRILAFWDGLLEHFAGDRTALGEALRSTAPALESDAESSDIVDFFESLASVPEESVVLASLPVRPIAAGDSELYAADIDETEQLMTDVLGDVVSTGDDVRVQILNGNGVPGIGAEVADRLIGQGFRVILSGNARNFDYETTLIVTYDESSNGQALAERARELLGVGEVQVSSQQQGSVDLTIVVGKDFLGAP